MAIGLQIGRIVYVRGEAGKAADAAALGASSRLDLALYRETGEVGFLPDAYATAQEYALRNAGFLSRHGLPVSVGQIWIDGPSQRVAASVIVDISSLLPGFLKHHGSYVVSGYAQARMQDRP